MRRIIPRCEPEVVEARARDYGGDTEKVATTSVREWVECGVVITSRYDKADEYEVMQEMIVSLDRGLASTIKSVFCDSKASDCFIVVLRNWDAGHARAVGSALEVIALRRRGGHNGITVEAASGGRYVDISPTWRELP